MLTWIRACERMPSMESDDEDAAATVDVLAWNGRVSQQAFAVRVGREWLWIASGSETELDGITHWMTMPEGP